MTKISRTHTLLLVFLSLIFLYSCAHMSSGHYVQLQKGDSIEKLAKEFKVPTWAIKNANAGKTFEPGSWVLVPLKRGFLGNKYRLPASTQDYFASGEFIWPVPSSKRISSRFGERWGRQHEGIDIPARSGSHILAAADGVVVYSGRGIGGYGNITVISHQNGFFTVYAHARRNFTTKGQRVHRGQVIGQVGSTGRSTGPHLHFEIRHDSRALDPKKYVSAE